MGIKNLAEIQRGHALVLASTLNVVNDVMRLAGEHAEQHVQRFAKFKRRTGKLQDTTSHQVVRTSKGRLVKIFNPQKYAAAIDTGARRHPIRARRRQFLRFVGRDGRLVFRRAVNHPGNRPYKFLFNATDAAFRVGGRFLRDKMSQIAKRF